MSKHRHRDRYYDNNREMGSTNRYGPINNNPFGITPQQLLNIFGGGYNLNNIGNILSSMNNDGFDLNAFGNQMNFPNVNLDTNMEENTNEKEIAKSDLEDEDENLELLISLRRIVDPKRVAFLDKVIDLYKKGIFKENNQNSE